MKAFHKEFLKDDPGVASGPRVFLAVFGKHPGWDDHIDDIGLETESLIMAKKLIYLEGIGSQISSGAWEKLDAGALVPFGHAFAWHRKPQTLVGKLWASSDGKRRTLYPMVACAHCLGTTFAQALSVVLPCLDALESSASAAVAAQDVRALAAGTRDDLRARLAAADTPPPVLDPAGFLSAIEFAIESGCMVKTLCEMARIGRDSKQRAGQAALTLRLPAASIPASLLFWKRRFAEHFDAAAPVFLAMPAGQYWMDAIVGEPPRGDFFCLRAAPQALPLTGDVLPDPAPDLREQAIATLEKLAQLEVETVDEEGGAVPPKTWFSRLFPN